MWLIIKEFIVVHPQTRLDLESSSITLTSRKVSFVENSFRVQNDATTVSSSIFVDLTLINCTIAVGLSRAKLAMYSVWRWHWIEIKYCSKPQNMRTGIESNLSGLLVEQTSKQASKQASKKASK